MPNPNSLMMAFEYLMKCGSTNNLTDKVLAASETLESSDARKERGSESREHKAKSLLGRWFKDYNTANALQTLFLRGTLF